MSVERVSLASGSNEQPFAVAIGGSAGLNIAGVGGKAGFADFTFDKTGITNTGKLAAGAAFFLLQTAEDNGLFTLKVGEYVTARDTTFTVTSGKQGTTEVTDDQVTASRYLRFGGQGFEAVSISISGGYPITAGVDEILYYQTNEGSYLKIVNANLALPSLALNASFEYQGGPDGTLVRLAARGKFGPPGSSAIEASAVGKFSNKGGELSMGVFIATKIGIPIIPGIVEISAIGGGFFLRPDVADLNSVINAVNLGTGGLSQNAQDLIAARRGAAFERIASGGEFAVMVYAGVGMIGTSGNYALDGRVLITLSDQAVLLDAAVGIYGFDANKLGAILNVNALFSPAFVSGAVVASMKVPTKSVMDVEATLDFYAGRSASGGDAWGIRGAIDGSLVTVLDIEGDLFIGPPGFYMGVEARIDVDLYLIKIGASLELEAWQVRDGSFGAYAEASAYIETKIGDANGSIKGAFIKPGSGPGYLYASGYAEALVR